MKRYHPFYRLAKSEDRYYLYKRNGGDCLFPVKCFRTVEEARVWVDNWKERKAYQGFMMDINRSQV